MTELSARDTNHCFYEITAQDLPLSCPMNSLPLWNEHPRIYLPITKTGQARCPYCNKQYFLKAK